MALSWTDVCTMAQGAFPEVEVSTYYTYPALKVRGRFFAGTREGEVLILSTDLDSRDMLIRADPEIFFLTDHYRDSEAVLVRLDVVSGGQLIELLEDAWRRAAPAPLVAELDAGTGE